MAAVAYFITHPEVVIDPFVPVSDWRLSSIGIRRIALMLSQPWVSGVRAVFSSAERKAVEAAQMDPTSRLAGVALDVPPLKPWGEGGKRSPSRTCSIFPVGESKMFSSSKRPVMGARVPGWCSFRLVMCGHSTCS